MNCEEEKRARKHKLLSIQLVLSCTGGYTIAKRQKGKENLGGYTSPKRQRGKEQQADQEDADILILDIDEFTIRQLNDVLKS
jgi:hypothetical protein